MSYVDAHGAAESLCGPSEQPVKTIELLVNRFRSSLVYQENGLKDPRSFDVMTYESAYKVHMEKVGLDKKVEKEPVVNRVQVICRSCSEQTTVFVNPFNRREGVAAAHPKIKEKLLEIGWESMNVSYFKCDSSYVPEPPRRASEFGQVYQQIGSKPVKIPGTMPRVGPSGKDGSDTAAQKIIKFVEVGDPFY